jgi:hypothetical protein
MADRSTFEQYYKLADMLIEKATKEQRANVQDYLRLISLTTKQGMGSYPWTRRWRWWDMTE